MIAGARYCGTILKAHVLLEMHNRVSEETFWQAKFRLWKSHGMLVEMHGGISENTRRNTFVEAHHHVSENGGLYHQLRQDGPKTLQSGRIFIAAQTLLSQLDRSLKTLGIGEKVRTPLLRRVQTLASG